MELKLEKSDVQINTELGVIDIWQVENGVNFTVEIFPHDQSDESFESAEYNNGVNILEMALNFDFFELRKVPSEWTSEQYSDIVEEVKVVLFRLLATIQNLEDFKEVVIDEGYGIKTPVYDTLKVIRNKYNDDICTFCGCEIADTDSKKEYARDVYCCEKCFQKLQDETVLTDTQYKKNYAIGEKYLIKQAEDMGWVQNEIVEDNYEFKYGLLLIGYEDEEHEEELGHVCIDLANLDLHIS